MPDELLELESWLSENEDDRIGLSDYESLIQEARIYSDLNSIDDKLAWSKIQKTITKTRKKTRSDFYKIAASLLFLISVSSVGYWILQSPKQIVQNGNEFSEITQPGEVKAFLELSNGSIYNLSENTNELFEDNSGIIITKDSLNQLSYLSNRNPIKEQVINKLIVPRGGIFQLTLSDGTRVWLNSDSELKYPAFFNGKNRDVYLTGEAYFEVSTDESHPFIVHLESSDIEVLGTSFNVSSYENNPGVAATLVEGRLKVSNLLDSEAILYQGQQSVIDRNSKEIVVNDVNTSFYISWVNGLFDFENMQLEYIVNQLGRWYDVEFYFDDPELKELHFTGAAKKENSIEFIIDLIERTSYVDFLVKDEKIAISARKN